VVVCNKNTQMSFPLSSANVSRNNDILVTGLRPPYQDGCISNEDVIPHQLECRTPECAKLHSVL
jgi:hypothetical protein